MARHLRPHIPPPAKHQKKMAALMKAVSSGGIVAEAGLTDVARGSFTNYPVLRKTHINAERRRVVLHLCVTREGPLIEVLWNGPKIAEPQCTARFAFWECAKWTLQVRTR